MNALEELTEDRIDKAHVELRVNDWERRINTLYDEVATWLPHGWTITDDEAVPMHEELMRRFGLPPRDLRVLRLDFGGEPRGRLEPRALWIIGNNGRLDLLFANGHFLIIDRSESFEPPDWRISSILKRRPEKRFNAQSLRDSLE